MSRKSRGENKILKGAAVLLFWLFVWALAARAVGQEILIPSPLVVMEHLAAIVSGKDFLPTVGTSLLRIICGFAAGCAAGTLLAVLCSASSVLRALLTPAVRIVSSVPVTSFIILVMLWIKYTYVPVFIAALLVAPILFGNVSEGIRATDPGLLEVAGIYGFGRFKTLRYLYIPSVMPYFYSGSVTGAGLAWKAGIAAEVLTLPKKAIGSGMYYSKLYLETADLFAWTIIVVVFSMLISRLLEGLMKKKAAPGKAAEAKGDSDEA
jgi:NitT/TauT family transport system permease protein